MTQIDGIKSRIRFCFDIDGVICITHNGDYHNSLPNNDVIAQINKLFDDGSYIILNTSRGMGTCKGDKDAAFKLWYNFTFNQLKSWGLKFNELHMGKPEADFYIDDRAIKFYPGKSLGELK